MGGGAIRTAAKAAVYRSTAIFGGPGTVQRFPRPNPGAKAHDEACPPAKTGADVGLSALACEKTRSEAKVQRPVFDLDDWELAGWAEEVVVKPRSVFGPVPTFEEAKAATVDLKQAIERVQIPQSAKANSVVNSHQEFNHPEDSAIITEMPNHVVQAFSFLQGSPEAQDVVASLASDTKVWDAVMKNEKVMEFFKNNQTVSTTVNAEIAGVKENNNFSSNAGIEVVSSSSFEELVQNFKIKVEEVVNNIASFFLDILATSPELYGSSGTKSLQSNIVSYTEPPEGAGASFFALAVATILVVLFKRVQI